MDHEWHPRTTNSPIPGSFRESGFQSHRLHRCCRKYNGGAERFPSSERPASEWCATGALWLTCVLTHDNLTTCAIAGQQVRVMWGRGS